MMFVALALMALACYFSPVCFAAAEGGATEAAKEFPVTDTVGSGLRALGLAIGAGIAIAGAGLGTGRAQGAVGAAGAGAIAEKPESFGNILLLFAIPETIVILGFVVAFLLLNKIV
ncbi:MAG: F0F1 ATP synthase subunit C [Candidatus Hydrogenedentes bacterium]|nr:F0F1 ATP synthase subunit C [Candidatus Hydrogenedentota bacterium]